MDCTDVIQRLEEMANPNKAELKLHKFGIVAKNALGVNQKELQKIASGIGFDNELAIALFDTGIYEAKLLCSKIYNPCDLTEELMQQWVATFDNWEICDSFCMGFFARSVHARKKIETWSNREEEFVKRAGFSMIAAYGFANKNAENSIFEKFLGIIEHEAADERHYVKKAINWALRNIGKRNVDLRASAIASATRIVGLGSRSARWIASDALRELRKPRLKTLDYPRALYRQQK